MEILKRFLQDPDLDRLSETVRWNGLRRIKDETVSHHSHTVSMFSMILAEEIFEDDAVKHQIVSYAILHDFDEIFTGDILNPVKYNELNGVDLREEIDRYIDHKVHEKFNTNSATDIMFRKFLTKNFPNYIARVVKVADWISMFHYIDKEIMLGNKGVADRRAFCIQGIRESAQHCIQELNKYRGEINFRTEILHQIKNSNYE